MSESCTHEVVTMTEFCPDCGAVFVPERGWTDIPALLAVAEAAAAAELLCSDMCPAHYDEPCSCGRAALRAALDAL